MAISSLHQWFPELSDYQNHQEAVETQTPRPPPKDSFQGLETLGTLFGTDVSCSLSHVLLSHCPSFSHKDILYGSFYFISHLIGVKPSGL